MSRRTALVYGLFDFIKDATVVDAAVLIAKCFSYFCVCLCMTSFMASTIIIYLFVSIYVDGWVNAQIDKWTTAKEC